MIRLPKQIPLGLESLDRVVQRQIRQRVTGKTVTRGPGRPKKATAGVSHLRRATLKAGSVLHVTVKLRAGLPRLRGRRPFNAIAAAIRKFAKGDGFRLVHFSVQRDHLHLLIEADGKPKLSRGMQKLLISVARRLNILWGEGTPRVGRVFKERYHAHLLQSLREIRHAIVYVLHNSAKHGDTAPGVTDPFSSAPHFDGYERPLRVRETLIERGALAKASTWMLTIGWKRGGLVRISEVPKAKKA